MSERERIAKIVRVADWIEQALAIPGADAGMALAAVKQANEAFSRIGRGSSELLMLGLYATAGRATPEAVLRAWVERAREAQSQAAAHG